MNSKMTIARSLNHNCLCQTLDRNLLLDYLEDLSLDRPNLFSNTALFISSSEFEEMKGIILAIESVSTSKSFKQKVLSKSYPVASGDFGPHGVFMGYDFHLSEEGPKLIEINTNAGGAFLNLVLAQAQMKCCEDAKSPVNLEGLEDKFFEIFEQEWKAQNKDKKLEVIVIMDENPVGQYLFPEFKLFAELFKRKGVEAYIADPSFIDSKEDGLWYQNKKIDLIYNRTTDFYFESAIYAGIKAAYQSELVVITPNPHHHAIFADKENLELLTSREDLYTLGVESSAIEVLLKGIPRTLKLTLHNETELWARRKSFFFKPTKGYGSKAAYRGDKITHRVWGEILKASYVAQEIITPGIRMVENEGKPIELKHDIRAYTYNGEILLFASRLYMGQTTNFRTIGGGFAPVFVI